ncbi:MAG: hypothetical protein IJV70_07170 [Clostridia bacterium]|nr:hypothetical protein [Clostridia bacterium]
MCRIKNCGCGGSVYYECSGYDPVHWEKDILRGDADFGCPDPTFRLRCTACGREVCGRHYSPTVHEWNTGESDLEGCYRLRRECIRKAGDGAVTRLLPVVYSIQDRLYAFFDAETEIEKYVAWRVAEVEASCLILPYIGSDSVIDVVRRAMSDYIQGPKFDAVADNVFVKNFLGDLLEEKYWYDLEKA